NITDAGPATGLCTARPKRPMRATGLSACFERRGSPKDGSPTRKVRREANCSLCSARSNARRTDRLAYEHRRDVCTLELTGLANGPTGPPPHRGSHGRVSLCSRRAVPPVRHREQMSEASPHIPNPGARIRPAAHEAENLPPRWHGGALRGEPTTKWYIAC